MTTYRADRLTITVTRFVPDVRTDTGFRPNRIYYRATAPQLTGMVLTAYGSTFERAVENLLNKT